MSLTSFLQQSFAAHAPIGWQCAREVAVLPKEQELILGFAPRADVLLENAGLNRRVWIEFEVSRADPVANHMKFAVGHLFSPQIPGDAFVSMVSDHVALGRKNLGASAVVLMRTLGMQAFQIPLFPTMTGAMVKELNHLTLPQILCRNLDIGTEIERALTIVEPVFSDRSHRVFFVSNSFEVSLNVLRWNQDAETADGARLWGRRTVTYFVYDPRCELFAPSKFCAFLPISEEQKAAPSGSPGAGIGMNMAYYCSIDQNERRFDGGAARRHFLDRLGYQLVRPDLSSEPTSRFGCWLAAQEQRIRVHPSGAQILIPGQLEY